MIKIAKHITSYLTIFSLLFSSLGVTIYYHHCNKEQITLQSITGKIKCNHHQEEKVEEQHHSCCNHSENEQSECSINETQSKNDLTIQATSCCVDSQVTKQLNNNFLNNSKQKTNENQLVTDNRKENSDDSSSIVSRSKNYIDKKIISPIKKFISLIRQLSKLASQSDTDSNSF